MIQIDFNEFGKHNEVLSKLMFSKMFVLFADI